MEVRAVGALPARDRKTIQTSGEPAQPLRDTGARLRLVRAAPALAPVTRPEVPLFTDVLEGPGRRRGRFGLAGSIAGHVVLIAALVAIPLVRPVALPPDRRDYIRALLYDPPPPPPPPLPKGSSLRPPTRPAAPGAPTPAPSAKPALVAPMESPPAAQESRPAPGPAESGRFGSETGSDTGVPEGMEEGVEGGVVGGVPGGVLGGVIGGTGTGPVPPPLPVRDPDRPPRPIRMTKPIYPQEAFIKKVEGTVVLEILIDAEGRVVRARVLHSVPLLDAAAAESVRQWLFAPAIKGGRPVPTLAQAPISFRIY
jgi:protein TonB